MPIISWVEKYRPATLDDVVGNDEVVEAMKKFIANKDFPHILLYGKQGRGKTSIALAIVNDLFKNLDEDSKKRRWMMSNVSSKRGIDYFRNEVTDYSKNSTVLRVHILDEFDNTTPDAQYLMRPLMEEYPKCKFIMTCNYKQKIIDPIKDSRVAAFEIKAPTNEDIKKRLLFILEKENQQVPDDKLNSLIVKSNGDVRKAINLVYTYCISKYDGNSINEDLDTLIKDFTKYSFNGDIENAIITLQELLNTSEFKTIIANIRDKILSNSKLPKQLRFGLLKLVCECEYRFALGVSDETLMSYFMSVSYDEILKLKGV